MDTPERLPRLCASSKAWPETRCENMGVRDLFGSTVPARRTERGVQTCGKPDSLLSALQHRRVTRLQEQVERLQQRTVELEDEQGHARKRFQDRLQQVHESWQDCFERHQKSWAKSQAHAEAAWTEEREHMQAQIAQLSRALTNSPNAELMEDAAVQAGVASSGNKSRSSQTPRPNTPHPSAHHPRGSWDLSRARSLPQDQTSDWAEEASHWSEAAKQSTSLGLNFGEALAAYTIQVASGPAEEHSQAASNFAEAAATYAQGLLQATPQLSQGIPDSVSAPPALFDWTPAAEAPSRAKWTSFNSCSSESSFGSEQSAGDNCFLPLEEEEEEGEAQPVPDQAWWEEFGEFESAPQVQPEKHYSQPRMVIDSDIIRRPVSAAPAQLTTGSISRYLTRDAAQESGTFWSSMDSTQASFTRPRVPHLDLSKVLFPHTSRWAVGMTEAFGQQLADDDNIWHELSQPAAGVASKPTCNAFELAIQEPEEGCAGAWTHHARFPTPSSNPRGLQGSAATPRLELLLPSPGASSAQALNPGQGFAAMSNPWGLQEATMPLMEVGHPRGVAEADVTYTPVEELLANATSSAPATSEDTFDFAAGFGHHDSDEATVEVMDMSVGDLVSVGGPDVCPWDGTSNTAPVPIQSSFTSISPDEVIRTSAQHDQAAVVEQGSQTEATAAGHSVHSTRSTTAANSHCSKGNQAMMDAAAERLLPLNCRVAARVSTKLPPLDHEAQLPPLPENFILPPEMHPVLGKYTYHGTQATQTSSTGSQVASKGKGVAAAADLLSGSMTTSEGPAATNSCEVKWLHYQRAAPPSVSGDVLAEAAARAGQTVQHFLAPMQMSSVMKDMLECTLDNSSYLPFSNRLCDSGFMTCQLAQLLAPIRSASAPLASMISHATPAAATAAAVDAVQQEAAEFEAAAKAVAAAEAEEAAIDAVADALLTQLGLLASEDATSGAAYGVESASDTDSDFEHISDADYEHNGEVKSRKRSAKDDWSQAGLNKSARGNKFLTAATSGSGAASTQAASSASAPSARLADAAQSDKPASGSMVSLADVHLDMDESSQEGADAAVCFANAESASDVESAMSEAESPFESVASSIASFGEFEAMSDDERAASGEWEML